METTTRDRHSASPQAQLHLERGSRTTLERIADLRHELGAFEQERERLHRQAEARLDALVSNGARRDTRGLYAFVLVACVASLGLLAMSTNSRQQDAVAALAATGSTVASLELPALAAAPPDTVATPPLEQVGDELEGAQPARSATVPDLPRAEDPPATETPARTRAIERAPRVRKTHATRKPTPAKARATTPVAAPAAAPGDVLAGLDDCGDDPICGF